MGDAAARDRVRGIYRLAHSASNRQTAAVRNCGHGSMYRGLERRLAPRHLGPKPALILLGRDALIECTVRDFSPAGAGILMYDAVTLPSAFDLRFDHVTRHCIAVWRQLDRIGLKFRSKD